MGRKPLIPQELAALTIQNALRGRVGLGTPFSCKSLSDRTGIPTRTLESYKDGTATPGLGNLLTLCCVLGPSFTSDVIAPCAQTARSGSDHEPEHMRILGAMGSLVAAISEAVKDGHVDHREAAQLRPMAADLMEILEPLTRKKVAS